MTLTWTIRLLLAAAAVVAGLRTGSRARVAALVTVATGTVGHLATTAFAAPTLLTLRTAQGNAVDTAATLDQFALLNALRATLMVITLAATVLALALSAPDPSSGGPRIRQPAAGHVRTGGVHGRMGRSTSTEPGRVNRGRPGHRSR